jgi:nitroimidazol reductase NimA-like FMN-containing flavoprotein (pyridoxamine 5'-phosphate oxidase superfamily)
MRRADKEIKDFNEIVDLLNRCDTIRLGMNGMEYPYVVPLSFGFEAADEKITIYIHGAKEGLKHDLIAKDNYVCVEASIFHRSVKIPRFNAITAEYESFIGFGEAEIVYDDEIIKGLDLICEHTGHKGFKYSVKKAVDFTRVYRIKIERFTGKRRFVEQEISDAATECPFDKYQRS